MDQLFGVTELVEQKMADPELGSGSAEKKEGSATEEYVERI